MKKLLCLILLGTSLLFTGCHEHTWTDATCTQPMTCQECGKTDGGVIEHAWKDANCINPKTCRVCGEEQGETVDHKWLEATCAYPKKCSVCYKTEGEAEPHDFSAATFETPKTCKNCGHTEGDVLPKLSASCDKVLIKAVDDETGDEYEIVANQTETHEGLSAEAGVIKNNEWLINLSSDNPIVSYKGELYDDLLYLGNGCFVIQHSYTSQRIYNVNKNNHFLVSAALAPRDHFNDSKYTQNEIIKISSSNSKIISSCNIRGSICELSILDTNTMQTELISIDAHRLGGFETFYPLSEGIFAASYATKSLDSPVVFFDLSGTELFRFDIPTDKNEQKIEFKDGQCTFEILNDVHTPYIITIDKQGNVLSSEKA